VVLEFNADKSTFEKVHQETYGKTGVRRIVPGQYIASDPMGRAFMVAAVEKQKFVYIMNRDSTNKLTISSPLDAHKSHTIIYDTCGVDVGHENPLFAVIESDYGEIDEFDASVITGEIKKSLTFYEMDLGLNHVIRKSTASLDASATSVLPSKLY
jgi:splicing factor 3B subunit 3